MSQIPLIETILQDPDLPRHPDPFDNILVAQAKSEGMVFLSADKLIGKYREPCVRYIL